MPKSKEVLEKEKKLILDILPAKMDKFIDNPWLKYDGSNLSKDDDPIFKPGLGTELRFLLLSTTIRKDGHALKFEFKLTFNKKYTGDPTKISPANQHYYSLYVFDNPLKFRSKPRLIKIHISSKDNLTEVYKSLRKIFNEIYSKGHVSTEGGEVKLCEALKNLNDFIEEL